MLIELLSFAGFLVRLLLEHKRRRKRITETQSWRYQVGRGTLQVKASLVLVVNDGWLGLEQEDIN